MDYTSKYMRKAVAAAFTYAARKKAENKIPKPHPTRHITRLLQIWGPMTRDELYKINTFLTPDALPNNSHVYQKNLCKALVRQDVISVSKFKLQKGEPPSITPRPKDVGKIMKHIMKNSSKQKHGFIDPAPWVYTINPLKLRPSHVLSPEVIEEERKKAFEAYEKVLAESEKKYNEITAATTTEITEEAKEKAKIDFFSLKSLGRLVRRCTFRTSGGDKNKDKNKKGQSKTTNAKQAATEETKSTETTENPTDKQQDAQTTVTESQPTEQPVQATTS